MTTTNPETTQVLLLASSDHNLDVLRPLLRNNTPNIQDPTTGFTPLHSAIASCSPESSPEDIDLAEKTLRLLLQNGAIWNTLDHNNETAGCVAIRLKVMSLYEIMVDAGVRAELLLGRLDGYMALSDGEEDEEEDEDEADINAETGGEEQQEKKVDDDDGSKMEKGEENASASVAVGGNHDRIKEQDVVKKDVNSEDYLKSELQYDGDKIVDSDQYVYPPPFVSLLLSILSREKMFPSFFSHSYIMRREKRRSLSNTWRKVNKTNTNPVVSPTKKRRHDAMGILHHVTHRLPPSPHSLTTSTQRWVWYGHHRHVPLHTLPFLPTHYRSPPFCPLLRYTLHIPRRSSYNYNTPPWPLAGYLSRAHRSRCHI